MVVLLFPSAYGAAGAGGGRWRGGFEFHVRKVQDEAVFLPLRAPFDKPAVLLPAAGEHQRLVVFGAGAQQHQAFAGFELP